MTIDILNNQLSGYTGSGSYVGSVSPSLTSADFGGASTLKLRSGTNPTLTSVGDVAIDTNITSFNGMIKYRDISQTLVGISIPTDDLASPTANYIIGYSSASSKLTLIPQNTGTNKIIGYNSAFSSVDDTTTSTSATNTSLSISYTPQNANNLLWIFVYGAGKTLMTGGNASTNRTASYYLRRTSGTASDIAQTVNGRSGSFNNTSPGDSFYSIALTASETAGDTSAHNYILRHACNQVSLTTTFLGSSCRAFIVVMEMRV